MYFRQGKVQVSLLFGLLAMLCCVAKSDGQEAKSESSKENSASAAESQEARSPQRRRRGGPGARGQRGPGQRGAGQRGPRRGPAAAQESAPAESAPATESKPAPKNEAKKVTQTLPQAVADGVTWRSIGPANMSGRITAITVYEKDPMIWWAATASGGLLKTTNNGVDFEHQFDDQATVSVGDVQVAQSNPDIVWVGTGENNPRNSVSWGDGVYKSTDGGKTWKNMGLKKTFQTGALAIHPENPDVVWVGSLGRLWGPNPERGLFKTTDGGETWKKVLYVNDMTGIIDVQLNPKNPDELLVATYERKRDGFDGNDPVQRFGAGSGIYKSTDGGESFTRCTKGLPSCKMGRIGLDYFEADPKYVYAVVESEKIAKEPENYSYMGLRGEDADVGAKVTNVTKEGPADKAGLKEDDIVVSIDGAVVPSYREMLKEVHKRQAGDTIKLVVSRDRKLVDVEVELDKKPKRSGRSSRSDFTGTLGGQAANLQDTQGPDGHEYGGIYMSEDGGTSWKRINSLNPRPMYYSNIQVDPVDRNNIYLCGTQLYKSKDGGTTFTNDGGSDGIHVDHHALWIDAKDPRHMILGNDGGIHVTWDRMEHWDHYNHVAIGQFYHVGVDSNLDYKVYGGLQDNGSWGGPSRGAHGSGPVNTDWFSVGGGDGFITRADPNDPNQIYFESQNGGMGRIHLETGARGFIRPRERGKRFRFNWKTPFILSPHNSQIHYSAGNYVFRSYSKGDSAKRISPEITNSDKGAGSAISESPMEAGIIYVGTTDGAVWMTKNGTDWVPLYHMPAKEEPKKEAEEKENSDAKTEEKKPADSKPAESKAEPKEKAEPKAKATDKKAADKDPVTGTWDARLVSEQIPEDRAGFTLVLKLKDGKIYGELEGRRGPQEISEGTFNAQTGAFSFMMSSGRGEREYSGKIKDGKMTGELTAGGGRFTAPFEAKRTDKESKSDDQVTSVLNDLVTVSTGNGLTTQIRFTADDPISGEWDGVVENENLPGGRVEFSIEMKMDDDNKLSGKVVSPQGDAEITEGVYNPKSKRILFEAENDQGMALDFSAKVNGLEMTGNLSINEGQMEVDFVAKRNTSGDAKTSEESDEKKSKPAEEKPKQEAKPEKKTEPKQEAEPKAKAKSEDAPAKDDAVSGKWTGEMSSPQGEQEFTVNLFLKSDKSITGVFESSRGEREITSGTFNPDTKSLTLVADSDQFTLEFNGTVKGNVYSGEMDINGGSFSMDFTLTKSGKAEVAQAETKPDDSKDEESAKTAEAPTGDKSLASLMPGPRWVSSIEASRFKKERCYITFDGHRSNDDGIYVFVTNDYGKTWESIRNNVPDSAGSVRVLREDIVNPDLLYLGCEFSSWYSIDGGTSWTKAGGGLPTVSVHEFAIHPTAGEVVAGTHGRSLWIADVSILRQLSPEKLAEKSRLYDAKDAIIWQRKPRLGSSGTRKFVGENPAAGTKIAYSLGGNARQVELTISNLKGDVVKTFEAPRTKGLHVFQWDLRPDSSNRGGRRSFARSLPTGDYLVRLKVDGQVHQSTVSVKADPSLSAEGRAVLERAELDEAIERFLSTDD